jgi:hypothetical protein
MYAVENAEPGKPAVPVCLLAGGKVGTAAQSVHDDLQRSQILGTARVPDLHRAALHGFEDNRLRYCSCDGLVPGKYDLLGEQRCIQGRAWIGHGRLQEEWNFTLLLAAAVMHRGEIDWAALLPQDTLTGWLTPDPQRKTVMIDPLSGHHA